MIEEILIRSHGSYSDVGDALAGLKTVNYIYGPNGTGKTTISRVIADSALYPSCSIKWLSGRTLERLVFNVDFARANFSSQMPGVFTLGRSDADALNAIEQMKQKISALETLRVSLDVTLSGTDGHGGKEGEFLAAKNLLEEECWNSKTKFDENFQGAFIGLRSSKARFCEKMVAEFQSNRETPRSLAELVSESITTFDDQLQLEPLLDPISFDEILRMEEDPILSRKIIGREDATIAALIDRLKNSDWVKEGKTYFEQTDNQCPFCQQPTDAAFAESLSAYFDDTYVFALDAIDRLAANYESRSKQIMEKLNNIAEIKPRYIQAQEFHPLRELLSAKLELNRRAIARKRSEPSTRVSLEPLGDLTRKIAEEIEDANSSVQKHNEIFENQVAQRAKLTKDIWSFVVDNKRVYLAAAIANLTDIDKAITNLKSKIIAAKAELAQHNADLHAMEERLTSVEPTVTAINELLEQTGFSGFSLKTADDKPHLYEIVRPNGTDASTTLSEGERTFVTFLYFFHLIKGSPTQSGTATDRIIVFDDPVSSLDSDILFVVSALIKNLLNEIKSGQSNVKQIFLLTHNVYFHKEIAFDPNRQRDGRRFPHETFWIVRKNSDHNSYFQSFDRNPIKSSYELLWMELRTTQTSSLTLQNTMRRILEYYFKLTGNRDKNQVIEKFSGHERQLCAALFAWVNDGSHAVYDDLYISHDAAMDPMRTVFKRVFEETNHIAHYEMMMGTEPA